jgi:dTDP-4-dehydrorhamnose 3,5-epimerase-like enzyme
MPALHRIELSPAKIWSDERGWGIEPFEAAGLPPSQLGNCHVVSLKPNAIRGNHYHTGTTEWLLICGGPTEVAWRTEDQPTTTLTVKEPVPTLLKIPPFVEHALRNLSQTEVILVSFSSHGERDTVCCSMLFD